MSASKLDKSLDEIISRQRSVRGRGARRGARRSGATGRPAPAAPVGGVKKNPRNAKSAVKPVPTGPSIKGDGRILVSNLPKDVDEKMIKEYFSAQCGPVKRAEIAYGPGGVSRGTATVWFSRFENATKAVSDCNNIQIDGKPIRIELLLDAKSAQAIPPPKALSERVTQPKAQPKSAATTKAPATTSTRGKKPGRRGGRSARPTPKTAAELDSEMQDYFQNGSAATESAAQPAATGDANMEDDIL